MTLKRKFNLNFLLSILEKDSNKSFRSTDVHFGAARSKETFKEFILSQSKNNLKPALCKMAVG